MSGVQKGQTVSVHYVGTLKDGTEFDNSRSREKTLLFEVGSGQMIPGFDKAVMGMTVGETKTIALEPIDAYGLHNPEAFQTSNRNAFPEDYTFEVGAIVYGRTETGQPVMAKIHNVNGDDITLDCNHPLAGKDLNFEIELIGIQ